MSRRPKTRLCSGTKGKDVLKYSYVIRFIQAGRSVKGFQYPTELARVYRMPEKNYKIIKRGTTKPRGEHAIDFADRKYNLPLCGCSNFTGEVAVGDIVGVIMSSNAQKQASFDSFSSLLSAEQISERTPQSGSYRQTEEHLFTVVKIRSQSRLIVEPYFLDSNKVIVKEVDESFKSNWTIPVAEISHYTLCEELFLNRSLLPDHDIPTDYDCFSCCKAQKFTALLTSIADGSIDISSSGNTIKALRPFHRFEKTLFNLSKHIDKVTAFFDSITRYSAVLTQFLTEDQIHDLGSMDAVADHMDALYRHGLDLIDSDIVVESVQHSLSIPSHLAVPTIAHGITQIKLSEVFRVYRPDPVYCLARAMCVSNWGGVIVDESVRGHIGPGCIVRVLFTRLSDVEGSEQPPSTELKGTNDNSTHPQSHPSHRPYLNVIYCRLLMRIDASRHLACIENKYGSEYEDIVLAVHSGAVSEIPFEWPGNEALLATGLDRSQGEGFSCTGMGAAVTATSSSATAAAPTGIFGGGSAVVSGGVTADEDETRRRRREEASYRLSYDGVITV